MLQTDERMLVVKVNAEQCSQVQVERSSRGSAENQQKISRGSTEVKRCRGAQVQVQRYRGTEAG